MKTKYIYELVFDNSNYHYIGYTCSPKKRLTKHIYNLTNPDSCNYKDAVYVKMRKANVRVIDIHVLEEILVDDTDCRRYHEREQYYIGELYKKYSPNFIFNTDRACGITSSEAQRKARATIIKKYGSVFGYCHTPEGEKKTKASIIKKYGKLCAPLHTPEVERKARETHIKLYGDPMGQCHTTEAQIKHALTISTKVLYKSIPYTRCEAWGFFHRDHPQVSWNAYRTFLEGGSPPKKYQELFSVIDLKRISNKEYYALRGQYQSIGGNFRNG